MKNIAANDRPKRFVNSRLDTDIRLLKDAGHVASNVPSRSPMRPIRVEGGPSWSRYVFFVFFCQFPRHRKNCDEITEATHCDVVAYHTYRHMQLGITTICFPVHLLQISTH